MPLFLNGDPIEGSDELDYIFGVFSGPDSDIDGNDGNDLIFGDYPTFFNSNANNSSLTTAQPVDGSGNWNTANIPIIQDAATIPHTSIYIEGETGQQEFFSVTVGAGETITADTDFSSFDTILTLLLADGTVLASNDDNGADPGSEFSNFFGNGELLTDSLVSYTNDTSATQTIIVRVSEFGGDGNLDGAEDTTLLHLSVTGHAAIGTFSEGDDTINGGEGDDLIFGLGGDDTLDGGLGVNIVDGGDGNDSAVLGSFAFDGSFIGNDDGSFTIVGPSLHTTFINVENVSLSGQVYSVQTSLGFSDERDVYEGDASGEFLFGGGGNDALRGNGGNDFIAGGAGADNLRGGEGVDVLNGGAGNDRLFGGADNDLIYTGDGVNLVFGEGGDDTLAGGNEVDKFFGGDGNDLILGGSGNDAIFGDDGNDQIFGQDGNDRLRGRNDDDTIMGGRGDDNLKGGNGLDVLDGGSGNDIIFGQSGDDTLIGGSGSDQLFGGSGNDIFRFAMSDGAGTDRVNDFNVGDTVELNGFGFANAGIAGASFVQFGNNVKFEASGLTIIFVNALVADVRAAISVDGNAELPTISKNSTTIAEDMFSSSDLKQDAIADFLVDQFQFDFSAFYIDHDGLKALGADDSVDFDWSDFGG